MSVLMSRTAVPFSMLPTDSAPGHAESNGCVANIGPRERRKRMAFGVVTLAVGVGVALALIYAAANPWWRLFLFLPFTSGAVGLFQALDKT